MKGLVHLYCGDGKGKTTAAVGLAVRAAGAGKRVVFAQFLKDGSSSELRVLRELPEVAVMHCQTVRGWYRRMDDGERRQAGQDYRAFLEEVLSRAEACDLLILDEAAAACRYGLIDEGTLAVFLRREDRPETVITGREPPEALLELADYITEMKKRRHPYDRGILAREGIEY